MNISSSEYLRKNISIPTIYFTIKCYQNNLVINYTK